MQISAFSIFESIDCMPVTFLCFAKEIVTKRKATRLFIALNQKLPNRYRI